MSTPIPDQPSRWVRRRSASAGMRTLLAALPAASTWAVITMAGRVIAAPTSTWTRLAWAVGVAVVALVIGVGLSRLTRRALPLVWLLKVGVAFPGTAPARFSVALRANRTADLAALAADAQAPADQRRAAERILVLATAITAHDRITRGHSERVRAYTRVVGEAMGLTGEELDKLAWAGLLHDVGKLVVEPEVLVKPGRLDRHERRQIRQHPVAGHRMAEPLLPWLGEWGTAILHHHERFDGTGYPLALAATDISLGGRIVAVADAFEAMTAKRPYNTPRSLADARRELARSAGSHFDPTVVRAFLAVPLRRLSWIALPSAGLSALASLPGALRGRRSLRVVTNAIVRGGAVTAVVGLGTVAAVTGAGDPGVGGRAPSPTVAVAAGGPASALFGLQPVVAAASGERGQAVTPAIPAGPADLPGTAASPEPSPQPSPQASPSPGQTPVARQTAEPLDAVAPAPTGGDGPPSSSSSAPVPSTPLGPDPIGGPVPDPPSVHIPQPDPPPVVVPDAPVIPPPPSADPITVEVPPAPPAPPVIDQATAAVQPVADAAGDVIGDAVDPPLNSGAPPVNNQPPGVKVDDPAPDW